MIYGSGIQDALANRGISSIAIDQPGTGEALRLNGLTALIEAEVWAGAVIDYLGAAKRCRQRQYWYVRLVAWGVLLTSGCRDGKAFQALCGVGREL